MFSVVFIHVYDIKIMSLELCLSCSNVKICFPANAIRGWNRVSLFRCRQGCVSACHYSACHYKVSSLSPCRNTAHQYFFITLFPLYKITVLLLFFVIVAIAGQPWLFMPGFKTRIPVEKDIFQNDFDIDKMPPSALRLFKSGGNWNKEQASLVKWHAVKFPNRRFIDMMPKGEGYGWYAHVFDVPQNYNGLDLIVDLGVIDDTDETYLNGCLVGTTGKLGVPNGQAWCTDRQYRIPAEYVRTHGNVLSTHVWNLWGLGGMIGPPVIKASFAPSDAKWNLAFIADNAAPSSGLNQATTCEQALSLCFSRSKPEWKSSPVPWKSLNNWPGNVHYAVFSFAFNFDDDKVSSCYFEQPVVLDLGPVFDVASVFLNNRRIALCGRFPNGNEEAFTEAAQRLQCLVEPYLWNMEGNNELTIVVYRERGAGGLPGIPGIVISSGADENLAHVEQLVQACRFDEAVAELDAFMPGNDLQRTWRLSCYAHLAFLRWLDGGRADIAFAEQVLASIKAIFTELPVEFPKQSAMQAFCRILRQAENNDALLGRINHYFPKFGKNSLYLGVDRRTQGNWPLFYGKRFYTLAAMGQICDWRSGTSRPRMKYKTGIPGERDMPRLWLPTGSKAVDWPGALLMHGEYQKTLRKRGVIAVEDVLRPLLPGEKVRRPSWWDDHGEMVPFDDAGPDLLVTLDLEDGCQAVSLYLVDYDWGRTIHPRQQSIAVFDAAGELLNAAWNGKSGDGAYERFAFEGVDKAVFRVCKHRGACVAVGGMFVDRIPELPDVMDMGIHENYRDIFRQLKDANGLERIRLAKFLSSGGLDGMIEQGRGIGGIIGMVSMLESSFNTCFISKRLCEEIRNLKSINDGVNLLTVFSSMREVHMVWYYAVAAQLLELHRLDGRPLDSLTRRDIRKVFEKQVDNFLEYLIEKNLFE